MKTWRLVSGILSMVMFLIISFQSCAVGFVNAVEENKEDTSGAGGIVVAFLLLVAGIVSTVFWRKDSKGGDITLIILFGLAALFGFGNQGTFSDLVIWSSWALFCAVMAAIACYKHSKAKDETPSGFVAPPQATDQNAPMNKFCKNCGTPLHGGAEFCPKCGSAQ